MLRQVRQVGAKAGYAGILGVMFIAGGFGVSVIEALVATSISTVLEPAAVEASAPETNAGAGFDGGFPLSFWIGVGMVFLGAAMTFSGYVYESKVKGSETEAGG